MLREVIARFSVDADTSKLGAANKAVDGFVTKLRDIGGALVGAEIVGHVKTFITDMVDLGDNLAATSAKLGIGTTALQQWQLAANLSDVETEAFNGSLAKFQINLAKAADGAAESKDAFKSMGIEDLDAALKDTPGALLTVARSIAQIGDAGTRNKKLVEVFGKQGAALGPMFSRGADGLEELLAQLEATGGGLSEDAIEAMAALDDETIKYNASVTSLKGKLALGIMPTISKFVGQIGEMVGAFSKSEGASKRLETAMQVLGAVGAVAAVKMMLPFAPMVIMIGGLILLVDDLKTGLEGGDSVTGLFLDKVFGEGAGDSIFKQINDDLKFLNEEIKKDPGKGGLVITLEAAGRSVRKFFVDDLNEVFDLASAKIAGGKGDWLDYGMVMLASLNPIGLFANVSKGYTALKGMLDEHVASVKAQWKKLGIEIPDDLWAGIKEGAADLVDNVGKLADDMIEAIKGKFSAFKIEIPLPGGVGGGTVPTSAAVPGAGITGRFAGALRGTQASVNTNTVKANQNIYITAPGASVDAIRRGVTRGMSDSNDELVMSLETAVLG